VFWLLPIDSLRDEQARTIMLTGAGYISVPATSELGANYRGARKRPGIAAEPEGLGIKEAKPSPL
jgi:hypothetical protein